MRLSNQNSVKKLLLIVPECPQIIQSRKFIHYPKKKKKFTHIGDSPVVQKQLGHGFKIFRELLDGFGELDADTLFSVLCGFQSEWISQRLSQIMK